MHSIKAVKGGHQLFSDMGHALGPIRKTAEEASIKDERRLNHFSRNNQPQPGAHKAGGGLKGANPSGNAKLTRQKGAAKERELGYPPSEPSIYMKFPEPGSKSKSTEREHNLSKVRDDHRLKQDKLGKFSSMGIGANVKKAGPTHGGLVGSRTSAHRTD